MAIPSGGLSTRERLELLQSARATVLLCTPTYALHMAEVARLILPRSAMPLS